MTCKILKWQRHRIAIHGWAWTCSCGQKQRIDGDKHKATARWRVHRDERRRQAEQMRHIFDPILTGLIRFRAARDSMRSDQSVANVAEQWKRLNDAKDEWAKGVSLFTDMESALDDWRDHDDTLILRDDMQLDGFLDRISEYV